MVDEKTAKLLSDISLSLFRKNFFGIYHGAISTKYNHNSFIINKKNAIFDEITISSLCKLHIEKKDYSWNIASIDADIHANIYKYIHEAKYIAFGMPPYTTAYALKNDILEFEDYFGKTFFGKLQVYNPEDFDSWYERNSYEIVKFLKHSKSKIMVIKGIGIYAFDRDINELMKRISILENSSRLIALKKLF